MGIILSVKLKDSYNIYIHPAKQSTSPFDLFVDCDLHHDRACTVSIFIFPQENLALHLVIIDTFKRKNTCDKLTDFLFCEVLPVNCSLFVISRV